MLNRSHSQSGSPEPTPDGAPLLHVFPSPTTRLGNCALCRLQARNCQLRRGVCGMKKQQAFGQLPVSVSSQREERSLM
jgi:hypothetical protein